LDWGWLLKKSKNGSSLLEKWAKSVARIAAKGTIHSACLKTNRIPYAEFAKCLKGARVDFDLVPNEIRSSIESACGGATEAKAFFGRFDFFGNLLDLDGYENYLRDQLVPTDTDSLAQLRGFALDFAESKIFLPYESVPGLWITTENRL